MPATRLDRQNSRVNHAAHTIITPYGWLFLEFGEEGPPTIEGPEDAGIHFEDCLSSINGPLGIELSLDMRDPDTMECCNRLEIGLGVLPPIPEGPDL